MRTTGARPTENKEEDTQMPAKDYTTMTDAEKVAEFNRIAEKKVGRKAVNSNKRAAIQALIKLHNADFQLLLKNPKANLSKGK